MEQKQVKIVPPEGYEVDKENSTFECIKFKPITSKRWRDGNPVVKGWYAAGNIVKSFNLSGTNPLKWKDDNFDVFATEKQAKSSLAMAQISQIMTNDERFGGAITDEEWDNTDIMKYGIQRVNNRIDYSYFNQTYYFLSFHTQEQRELFLKENEDLVKAYLMLD